MCHRNHTLQALALLLFLTACAPAKRPGDLQQTHEEPSNLLQPTFPTSAPTRLFISELNRELAQTQVAVENYIPSARIAATYGIINFNNKYYIQGFITASEGFAIEKLQRLDITTGKQMGQMFTAQIPFASLDAFFKTKGIAYFEIATKAETK